MKYLFIFVISLLACSEPEYSILGKWQMTGIEITDNTGTYNYPADCSLVPVDKFKYSIEVINLHFYEETVEIDLPCYGVTYNLYWTPGYIISSGSYRTMEVVYLSENTLKIIFDYPYRPIFTYTRI